MSLREDERSRVIVDAATSCFLQFGYAKTSLDDIAQRAGLSRPLLYRKFKNKEEIFAAVYDEVHTKRYPLIEAIVDGKGTPRSKLERMCEVIYVEPWAMLSKAPAIDEFYAACDRVIPLVQDRHDKKQLELVDAILHDKELARVFLLAVEGMYSDLPTASVLRRRLTVLVERFT